MKIQPEKFVKEFCKRNGYLYYKVYKSTEFFIHGKYHVDDLVVIDEKHLCDISTIEKFTNNLLSVNRKNTLYNDLSRFIGTKKLIQIIEKLEDEAI